MMTTTTTTFSAPLAILSIGSLLEPAAFAEMKELARSNMDIMQVFILWSSCLMGSNTTISASKRNVTDGYSVRSFVDVLDSNIAF